LFPFAYLFFSQKNKRKMNAKIISFAVVAMFVFGLFICSCFTARQCYVTPCYDGKGLQMLWSVDWGESIQVVLISLLCVSHVVLSYFGLFKMENNALLNGFLVSSAMIIAVVLLTQAVFWGQQSIILQDLDTHLNGYAFFSNNEVCETAETEAECDSLASNDCDWVAAYTLCQKAMHIDQSAKQKFDTTTVFSVLVGISEAFFAYILLSSQEGRGVATSVAVEESGASRSRLSSAYVPKAGGSKEKRESNVFAEGPGSHADNAGL